MKIALKKVIGQFLNSSDESSHQFLRLWNIAVFGLQTEFNLDITGELKTVVIDVNPNKSANLPSDYITFSKVGVINSQGEIVTFKRNDQLSSLNGFDTQSKCRNSTAPNLNSGLSTSELYSYGSDLYYNYFAHGTTYQLFGVNSGTAVRGHYKIDESSKVILLDPQSTYSEVVLEYLGDGFDSGCDDYAFDVRAAQAMVSYLRWQNAIDKPKKFGLSQVLQFKREYYNQKRLAKMRINPFNLAEFQKITRETIKLVPKA